jgi:hypothetical protein
MGERVLERQPPKKPVIKNWFEPGSVILKILVVNPSQTETQAIPVKVYLPKEVNSKDITNLGGLKLEYDQEAGMYFVHDEVTLGPGQSITKTVEIKDVWVFTEEQLSPLVTRARESAKQLEKTPYAEKAAGIVVEIERKVEEILKKQRETATNPAEHIRAYRQAITTVATIEQDLSALEKLKPEGSEGEGQEKSPPAKRSSSDSRDGDSRMALASGSDGPPDGGAPLGRSISMTTAWRIIFAILAFLAVLSAIFFITWHRLVRITMEREQQELPLSAAPGGEKG